MLLTSQKKSKTRAEGTHQKGNGLGAGLQKRNTHVAHYWKSWFAPLARIKLVRSGILCDAMSRYLVSIFPETAPLRRRMHKTQKSSPSSYAASSLKTTSVIGE